MANSSQEDVSTVIHTATPHLNSSPACCGYCPRYWNESPTEEPNSDLTKDTDIDKMHLRLEGPQMF